MKMVTTTSRDGEEENICDLIQIRSVIDRLSLINGKPALVDTMVGVKEAFCHKINIYEHSKTYSAYHCFMT